MRRCRVMKDFRISIESKKWFEKIRNRNALEWDFDILYFCFLAGVATDSRKELKAELTSQLVNYFPKDYERSGELLVALFLRAHVKAIGVSMGNKEMVFTAIEDFIDQKSLNYLTDKGVDEFSKYVYGGYNVLANDWFDVPPRKFEVFLRQFQEQMDLYLGK